MSLFIIIKKPNDDTNKLNSETMHANMEDPFVFYNLNDALNELRQIYKTNANLLYDSYHIKVYIKKDNKFILTHHTYYHQ